MKKFTIMGLCMVIAMIFGISGVKAADGDGDVLVPFVGNAETSSMSQNMSFSIFNESIKVGDVVDNITVLKCVASQDNFDTETQMFVFNKSACTAVTPTWNSTNTSVATVDQNGKITFVGSGKTTISATSEGVQPFTITVNIEESSSSDTDKDSKTDTNTDTNTNTNTDTKTVEKDEPTELVEKKQTVEKEEEVIKGTQTKTNPATGIKEALIFILPISLIVGSALFLKRRMA